MDKNIILSRQELYMLVWSNPITKLAKEYGLSDVGLSKLCIRHKIPTPDRGYWTKKQHNTILARRPKLPVLSTKNIHLEQIIITPKQNIISIEPELDVITDFEHLDENKVLVDYSVELTHPVVIKTAKSLNCAKPSENGSVYPKAKKCLDIKVTRECIDRAAHIMDTLLTALETRGAHLKTKFYAFHDKEILGFELNGIHIQISLVETIKRSKYLKSADEITRVKKDPYYRYKLPQYVYTPTGKLTLKMEGLWSYNGRKSWSDAKVQRIDNCINDFLWTSQCLLDTK